MKKHFVYIIMVLLILPLQSCKKKEEVRQVDVLVIGGTTGGISAGLQSARLGVTTLIVEETSWLGGMITAAGVSATDGNHHLHSGIWNEFRQHLRDFYGGAEALATGWVSHTQFEPHIGDRIFKNMAAAEKNLQVVYGYYLVSVQKQENQVVGAIFENEQKEKLIVRAEIVIDATDLGDGLKMAGTAYRLGMDAKAETGEAIALDQANNIVQDLTWVAVLKDYGKGTDQTIPRPEGYDPRDFEGCCDLTVDGNAINCEQMLNYGKLPHDKFMLNWPKKGNDIYLNVVELDRNARNEELKKAKNKTLCFVYHIQQTLGFTHYGLADDEFPSEDRLALIPYYREGRRLKGIVTLNYNHVEKPYQQPAPLYRTGISVGDYPVDHHHKCNPAAPDLYFLPVPSFNVPLGALIPESTDGLIVADKAISVTNLVNGSTRLQPCVLLTGQAAGALAALSVKNKMQARNIPVRQVQKTLLDAGAYIMPLFDVNPKDSYFMAAQRITATGIIRTTGEAYQWANRTWFYPDSVISVAEFTSGLHAFDEKFPVVNNTSFLTIRKLNDILSPFIKEPDPIKSDHPDVFLQRKELAVLLDEYLKPFEREITHEGIYK
ncbi:hypothetical protein AGMMS50239_09000 [Bacteroidia bacterium]|nr:hypothetical protein AGMMS50239_09000 [Bacteroidia bacterium]